MSSAGTDLNGRGNPAQVFENVSDPDAADRIATGKKSQAGELTQSTNQLLLQSTEDSRYDPAPVERKVKEKYTNYNNNQTLNYVTLTLLLVAAFVIIKT